MKNVHRCIIEFDDGVYAMRLQHPAKCEPPVAYGECGRHVDDQERAACPDCQSSTNGDCWVQGWFDSLTASELFQGEIEVAFEPEVLNEDGLIAHIVEAKVADR